MCVKSQMKRSVCIDDSACLRGSITSILESHLIEKEAKQFILDKVNHVTCGNVTCLDVNQIAELLSNVFSSVEVHSIGRIEDIQEKIPAIDSYVLLLMEGDDRKQNQHAMVIADTNFDENKLLVMDSTLGHEQFEYHYRDFDWFKEFSPKGFKLLVLHSVAFSLLFKVFTYV